MPNDDRGLMPRRQRGVRADRDKLFAALMGSELERKTQAAVAERIADLEKLDAAPRDLVSRVFREQAVDRQSLARVAMALGVAVQAISEEEPAIDDVLDPTEVKTSPAEVRASERRSLGWRTVRTALVVAFASIALTAISFSLANALIANRESQTDRRTLAGFFAEIGDVYRHYLYSEAEIVSDPAAENFDLQLKLAAYGDLAFARAEIAGIGLPPEEIRWAMELLLLVRNNDIRISEVHAITGPETRNTRDLVETLRLRMRETRDLAYTVLVSINERAPQGEQLPLPPERYERVH